jgi:CubicO group peptidase (beta-lactamase class C family)
MKLAIATAILLLLTPTALASTDSDRSSYPGAEWGRTTPEAAGWPTEKLAEAHWWSMEREPLASVIIVQHGSIVAEWGDTTTKSNLHSGRKSLLSALIGIAVAEHKIDLNATIQSLEIDDTAPSLTNAEKQATVRDLLESRSGIYHSALCEAPESKAALPARESHPPGTFWFYNNWDFNTLGTIYEKEAGESIFTAFEQKIAAPIGMQDYQASDGHYVRGEDSLYPCYMIRMSARDLARFALLYLHEGNWRGQQIVPAEWVRESTTPYSKVGNDTGYGYLWWTASVLGRTVKLPPGSFFAAGAYGQYAFIIPALDLIVVQRINSDIPFGPLPGQRKPTPRPRETARLLWLIMSAAGAQDIGSDPMAETGKPDAP